MAYHKLDDLSFQPELEAYGLFSSLSEARFCYELNRSLGLKLIRKKKDFSLNRAGKPRHFSSFAYNDKQRAVDWFLLKNKTLDTSSTTDESNSLFSTIEERVYWINAKNKFDFILWLESNDDLYNTLTWLKAEIKNLRFLNAAQRLDKTLINQLLKNTQP